MNLRLMNALFGVEAPENGAGLKTSGIEIHSPSVTISCIVSLCFLTIFVNFWVCFKIYRNRHFRYSHTALMIANIALVDILVSLKDLPFLLSVVVNGDWYFETSWCRSQGLTNVVYIVLSVSAIMSIVAERCVLQRKQEETKHTCGNPTSKVVLLGYIIAQSTLSYSLVLLWSKYIFIGRKAFCHVEELSSTNFIIATILSLLFLIPTIIALAPMVEDKPPREDCTQAPIFTKSHVDSVANVEDNSIISFHGHLQAGLGVFLLSWIFYVVHTFLQPSGSPCLSGIISAAIPMLTTSFIPLVFVLTYKPKIVEVAKATFLA